MGSYSEDPDVAEHGFFHSSIAGVSDGGGVRKDKDGKNAQFVSTLQRQAQHSDGKKRNKDTVLDALRRAQFFDLHNSVSPYALHHTKIAPTSPDVPTCESQVWSQVFMYNLYNTGWYQLLSALRDEGWEVLQPLDKYEWEGLANNYGIGLNQRDMLILCDEDLYSYTITQQDAPLSADNDDFVLATDNHHRTELTEDNDDFEQDTLTNDAA